MIHQAKQGAVAVIGTDEPLAGEHVEQVAATLQECLGDGPPLTVFDMAQVPVVDSAGIELLLDVAEGFAARGGAFKIAAANALCRDAFVVTGLGEQIETYEEVTQAVRSFLR